MTIVLISSSLKNLDNSIFCTSSEKYEFELASSLSHECKVVIFSANDGAMEFSEFNNIKFCKLKRNYIKRFWQIKKELSNDDQYRILFWGYDLQKVLFLMIIKLFLHKQVIPFIYDSHKESTNQFPVFKRMLSEVYFGLGKSLIKYFDGAILFQEEAAKELKLKKTYHITKPGVVAKDLICIKEKYFFTVTFAGSFTRLNYIPELLEAFSDIKLRNICLNLYGDGYLLSKVLQYADEYPNITYCGLVKMKELQEAYANSNVLVNLRNLDDICMKYSFPSKLFEILMTGVPVITTDVFQEVNLSSISCVVTECTPSKIKEAIMDVYFNYDRYIQKAKEAAQLISVRYNSKTIAKELYEYITSVGR